MCAAESVMFNFSLVKIWSNLKKSLKPTFNQGRIQRGAIAPPKTYESNFFYHDFVQFGKQHWRYKAILTSIVLPQKCCEVYFMPFAVMNSLWDLTAKYYWNRPPKLTGWQRRSQGGCWRCSSTPLSDQDIDVYFLSFSPTLYCKSADKSC